MDLDWRNLPGEEQGTSTEIKSMADVNRVHGTEPIDVKENYLTYTLKFIGITALSLYMAGGLSTSAWTPKQIKAYNKSGWMDRELKYAKTYEDSLNIYKTFNFPIILQASPIKEEVIKQNDLEKSVK